MLGDQKRFFPKFTAWLSSVVTWFVSKRHRTVRSDTKKPLDESGQPAVIFIDPGLEVTNVSSRQCHCIESAYFRQGAIDVRVQLAHETTDIYIQL